MADKEFTLRIITPERVFYEGIVDMVEFNTTEGQIGVLPGHIPLTVIVKPGILVDPSGHHQSNRRSGENHPYPGAYGRDHQQTDPREQTAAAGAGKRTDPRRDRGRDEHAGRQSA